MHEKPIFIQNNAQLRRACENWIGSDAIGLDTEFERTRTYYSRPALVQVFDGQQVSLVDPLTIDDFAPLAALPHCTNIPKVMSACNATDESLVQSRGLIS